MGDKDVGFVGLGIMGRPMAKNLINAGYSLTVYDVVGTAVEELATEGAAVGSSSREVAGEDLNGHNDGARLRGLGGRHPGSGRRA